MRLQINSSFEDYIGAGDTTTSDLLNGNGPSVQALRAQYRFFAQTLWANADGLRPIPAMMGLNAFMLLLAGVRVALTGHAAATFPVLRTALESSCYALLMT